MPYLMAVDIGNSDISVGVFAEGDTRPKATWRMETRSRRTKDEYGLLLEKTASHYGFDIKDICHIIVSCVVPLALKPFFDGCVEYINVTPVVLGHGVKTGIKIQYNGKDGLPTDRVANLAAVVQQFPLGAVVVDCGTLINLDVVGKGGVYMGGNILPGPLLMHQALIAAIPKMAEVPRGRPDRILGLDMTESVQNGVYYSAAGALKMMLAEIQQQSPTVLPVIATGGFATELATHVAFDHIEPDLTLMGLKQIHDRNK